MKPRHEHEQEGERRSVTADASASERLERTAFPGREPGARAAVAESPVPMSDLAAWLERLEDGDELGSEPARDAGRAPAEVVRVCPEAEELLLALAEVCPAPRGARAKEAASLLETPATARDGHRAPRRFDARLLAERLLAESQQHAVASAAPADLLAAQGGLDALSEDLLAELLAGLAVTATSSDSASTVGSHERGLLALLALQLYVHETKARQARRVPEVPTEAHVDAHGEDDERLLEALAVPHAASMPIGERRPRGRPRR